MKDILRCLGDRRTTKLHDHFDELRPKRLKIEEVEEGTQAAKNPEAEATDEESKVFPLQRVVFIDSTWNQTNKIITDERLQGNHKRLKQLVHDLTIIVCFLMNVFSCRSAPGRTEDEKNMFLAPSEGQARHLPLNH